MARRCFFVYFVALLLSTEQKKTAHNIINNTTMVIPAHNIPAFKPAKSFVEKVK